MQMWKWFKGREDNDDQEKPIDYIKLLQIAVEEEHWALQSHQNRVAFYASFITAILAISIAGFIDAKETMHYLILLIGPIIVFVVSLIALDGTFRFYQRALEAITIRAKCEQAIGITDSNVVPKNVPEYWKEESLIPDRYLEARTSTISSSEFINQNISLGYQKSTRRLFIFFQGISIVFGLVLIGLAIGIIK